MMIFNIFIVLLIWFIVVFHNEALMLYQISYRKEKTHPKAIVRTFKTLNWILYLIIYQKIFKNVVHVQKHEYEVHYVYNGQLYKIKIVGNSNLYKKQIIMILNERDDDITNDIVPYLGPKYDFHKINYQPRHFNQDEITFYLANGETRKFSNHEDMIFTG